MCCEYSSLIVKPLEKIFIESYEAADNIDTDKLQGVAKLFAYLLSTNSISWTVLSTIHLKEDKINPSRVIFVKTLFLELVELMGYCQLSLNVVNP